LLDLNDRSIGRSGSGSIRSEPLVVSLAGFLPSSPECPYEKSMSKRRTILVAEDHADSREAVRALLEAVGYRVRVAVNGREAIDSATADPPDLILMDIMMPEVDGLEATRALRARSQTRHVPIIAVTAMGASGEISREAGCNGHVAKPIDVPRFLDAISRSLRAHDHRENGVRA